MVIVKDFINIIPKEDIFLIIPLLLTFFELLQIRKSRTAEILYNIFNDIHSGTTLQNIEWLYTMDLSNYCNLSAEEKRKIDDIIDVFDRISFLCEKWLIPKKYFVHNILLHMLPYMN